MAAALTDYPHRDPWTTRVGPPPNDDREMVLIVPPLVPLTRGFARAAELLRHHRVVRVIARGATTATERPAVPADGGRTLLLSELEGYRLGDRSPAISAFMPSVERWLRQTLDVVPGFDAAEVFWTAAMYQLFDPLEDFLLARAIATLHAQDRLECVDETWRCFRFIQAQVSGVARAPTTPMRSWRLRFLASWCAMLPLSLGKRVVEYARQIPSRRRIRALRRSNADDRPALWVGVVGDSPAISRPILELIPKLQLGPRERIGVLLQSRLDPGLRWSMIWNDVERGPVLPCLDHESIRPHVGIVDQGVSAEHLGELLRVFLRTVVASATAATRIARLPPCIGDGTIAVPIEVPPTSVAKLATLEVLRATEAAEACARMFRRTRAGDSVVLLAQAHWPGDVVVAKALESEGALTAEIEHGGLAETALSFSASRVATGARVLWTIDEAEALQPYQPHQLMMGGYLPRPVPRQWKRPSRAANESLRVLVASNYLPAPWGGDLHKWDAFQAPLLRDGTGLLDLDRGIELRWRPHPSDDAVRVAEFGMQFPEYAKSTTSLDEDLKWCDILVTSLSSIIVEALWYSVPIFVHDIPLQTATTRRVVARERRFGASESLRDQVASLMVAMRNGMDVMAPERGLRARLFGASGEPLPARQLLDIGNYRGRLKTVSTR